jgi:hypothetical protein
MANEVVLVSLSWQEGMDRLEACAALRLCKLAAITDPIGEVKRTHMPYVASMISYGDDLLLTTTFAEATESTDRSKKGVSVL